MWAFNFLKLFTWDNKAGIWINAVEAFVPGVFFHYRDITWGLLLEDSLSSYAFCCWAACLCSHVWLIRKKALKIIHSYISLPAHSLVNLSFNKVCINLSVPRFSASECFSHKAMPKNLTSDLISTRCLSFRTQGRFLLLSNLMSNQGQAISVNLMPLVIYTITLFWKSSADMKK